MSFVDLHKRIERNSGLLIFGILVVASIGGLVQIVPSMFQESLSTPIEGIGWIAYCTDTESNMFGLLEPDVAAR